MTPSLRRMVGGVLVCAAIWFVTASGQEPAAQSARRVADEVIVQYKPQSPRSRRDAIVARRGARVLRRLDDIERLRLPAGAAVDAEIAALEADPDVEAAQPNFIREVTLVPNDPYWTSNQLWGLLKIQAPSAWTISTGSQQVVVADIDTGVNYTHPDLAQNMWRNPGEIVGNGIDDDANGYVDDVYGIDPYNGDSDPMDDHSHGTHTAGTIGAVGNNGVGVAGVNWNVRILACKVFNASGSGTDSAAIECFRYITALKNKGINIRVSSNSWGSTRQTVFPSLMKNAIDAAAAAGILNVFAAGNSSANNDVTPFDPASIDSPGTVSVAASDSLDDRASFSNYGATSVDIAAPGVSIVSTGITDYLAKSGTSMATPHVAGVAALVSGLKPTLTPAGIRTLIMNSADPLSNWSGIVASGGRLNAYLAALDAGGDIAPTVSLTSPVNGATFSAPATITVAGIASDADGTVSKVDFYANGALIGTDTTSPYSVSWTNVAAGAYNLTAVATDNRLFTTTSTALAVTVTASGPPLASRVNVALAANGGVATSSSVYANGYEGSGAINGDRSGTAWGAGGGWADGTYSAFPDWLRVDFGGAKTIDEIDVFSVQDNYGTPSLPTSTMTFGLYGLTDFQVQYWTGTAWATVPGGTIAGNQFVWRQIIFSPITTTSIRVLVNGSLNSYSRIVELEAYGEGTAAPPPTSRVNMALAANGGVATSSSVYANGYEGSGAINGDRNGTAWGAGGGWADGTYSAFPDWLQVSFATAKTIDEVDVFSVQDNYGTPSLPTSTMTFGLYGLTDFQVQYWTGAAWATVPGGTIAGNQFVWRQIIFSPITTTSIRVLVNGSLNSYSRIVELEAYGEGTAAPPPTSRVNVALAANGGVATSSSVYANGYGGSGAINGDRNGTAWGAGGGWADGTYSAFPDWLRVDFAGAKTIDEIDVFTVQDNYGAPSVPASTTTFALYGLTDFQVQYWTGATWATVPGGTIAGNTLVWRQITFSPVTTTGIRVLVNGSLNGYSRIVELEAYAQATGPGPGQPLIGFPSDNWWNLDISNAPIDANSAAYIAFIGGTRALHPDFGGLGGLPYIVVDDATPKVAVQFGYSDESDGVDHSTNVSFPFYPIPAQAITERFMIEGAEPGNVDLRSVNDRHLLVVNKDQRHLYELWNVFYDGTTWHGGSGAFFDMNTNDRRPDGWTSADAAGLAILPGLVRYDEAFGTDEIRHAFRVTVRATNGYVFPASHRAGATAGALPMGARLRLKASKDLSAFAPDLQRIFRAMQRYGLIVADNGSDMFITGAYDSRWSNDVLNPAFRALHASDFDVIELGYR